MRRMRSVLSLVLPAALLLVAALPARAQTSNQERERQLRDEIQEVTAEEAVAQAALAEVRARKAEIDARVAELDGQLAAAMARAESADAEAARAATALDEAERKLAQTEAELEAAKAEVRASAGELYRSARRGATFDVLTVGRPADLVAGSQYLDRVNHDQRRTTLRIGVLRDEVAEYRKVVAETKERADAAAADAQRARDEIATLRTAIEPARAEADAQAAAETEHVGVLEQKRSEAEAELEEVSAAIAAELRAAAASGGEVAPQAVAGGCDARPVSGSISSGFGQRWGRLHAGVDIPASTGTPIRACFGGVVRIAGWQSGYGNTVVIDHGGGVATLYAHQSSIAVSTGQAVSSGTVIGYVGSTGNSTGPHLHFEVRMNGEPVNPAGYV